MTSPRPGRVPPVARAWHIICGALSGLDLKIGGEGMNKFYDEILPATANKLGKKFGARVQRGTMPTGDVSRSSIAVQAGASWTGSKTRASAPSSVHSFDQVPMPSTG
jgi:hypothetical protein